MNDKSNLKVRIGEWFTVADEPDSIWIALRYEPRYAQAEDGALLPGALIGKWVIAGGLMPNLRTYSCFAAEDCVPAPPEAAAEAAARVERENARVREARGRYPHLKDRPEFPDRNTQATTQYPLEIPLVEMGPASLRILDAHMRIITGAIGEDFTLDDFWEYVEDNDLTAFFSNGIVSDFVVVLYTFRWKYDDQRRQLYQSAHVARLGPDEVYDFIR